MKHAPSPLGIFVCLVVTGCQDLNLAELEETGGGSAQFGGSSATGGRSGSGGTTTSGKLSTIGGGPEIGGAAGSTVGSQVGGRSDPGGSSSIQGTAQTGGEPSIAGATAGGGVAPETSTLAAGGVLSSGGMPSSGGNPSPGGGPSTGGASGLSSAGHASGTGGSTGTNTLVSAPTGGTANASTGGATFGQTSSLGGASTSTGGLPATGGTSVVPITGSGGASTGGAATGGAVTGGSPSTGGAVTGGAATGGAPPTETLGSGGATVIDAGAGPDSSAPIWEPCQRVTTLAQSPQSLGDVYVGCSDGSVYTTTSGLSESPSWLRVDQNTGSVMFGIPQAPINAVAVASHDANLAYLAVAGSKQGHKLWKTTDHGSNWIEVSGATLSEIWSISINPLNNSIVYLFGPGGPSMSSDGGLTWTSNVTASPMRVPLATGAKLTAVSVVPGNLSIIWVGASNGEVFYTEDATTGQTWLKAKSANPERAVTHLALDISRKPVDVFATYDGMYTDSVWVTGNNGFGWSTLQMPGLPTTTQPLPGIYAFYGISINPVHMDVMYIDGTYGSGVTTTKGSSWVWTDQ